MSKTKSQLPIDDYLEKIKTLLDSHNNLVLVAEPGAGKTTRVPPTLTQLTQKQIVMLEPRRIAALSSAKRIAEENSWQLGQDIGYQVRFENKTSSKTKIKIVTEAILSRQILSDPELNDVGIVILDEFHERSIHTDSAIGLLKELQELSRPDLKIVIMSATLEADKLSQYLNNAPILKVPGRTYPIEVHYQNESQILNLNQHGINQISDKIKNILNSKIKTSQGNTPLSHTLVFLPGLSEINRVTSQLEDFAFKNNFELLKLHGSLTLEEQSKVLSPSLKNKIILSTNIAETSLTIDGVDTVIDSGLQKTIRFDIRSNTNRLETTRISQASATQRAGRAGRQREGSCYKLWNKLDERSLQLFEQPEIMRADLCELFLFLAKMGVRNFLNFSWFESPPEKNILNSQEQLISLGALKNDLSITQLGERLSKIPLHPRIGKVIITAEGMGLGHTGAELAALLQERDFILNTHGFSKEEAKESDIYLRFQILNSSDSFKYQEVNKAALNNTRATAEQLKRYTQANTHSPSVDEIKKILLFSFIDRLAKRRAIGSDSALMVGGRGIKISQECYIQNSMFFVVVNAVEGVTQDILASLVSGVEKSWIEEHFKSEIKQVHNVEYDLTKKEVLRKEYMAFRDLPLEEERRSKASEQEILELLPQILSSSFSEVLEKNTELKTFCERLSYYRNTPISELFTKPQLEDVFTQAAMGHSSFDSVTNTDLKFFFESIIETTELQNLNRTIPAKLLAPSGVSHKIHYSLDKAPFVEIRIQELFGLLDTPKLGPQNVPLTIHLLGPNYRPMQVTSDLKSFWQNGYHEVKRELKARYPKHSWPDDPLTATPEAKGKRRQT